jgi:hypothetical protein
MSTISRAYRRLAQTARAVMVGDLETQLAVRSEVRREVRNQLPLMSEAALAQEISQISELLRTSVVQARFNESTGIHAVQLREDLLSKDGSVTNLEFLTPDQVLARLDGAEPEVASAIGCKSKK